MPAEIGNNIILVGQQKSFVGYITSTHLQITNRNLVDGKWIVSIQWIKKADFRNDRIDEILND